MSRDVELEDIPIYVLIILHPMVNATSNDLSIRRQRLPQFTGLNRLIAAHVHSTATELLDHDY